MSDPSALTARSVLSASQAHFEDRDALYGDLNALASLLDDTLRRQESEEFLALVESVRSSAGRDMELSFHEFENLDLETASQLVRAFSMYFHLANITEQTHRARQGRQRRRPGQARRYRQSTGPTRVSANRIGWQGPTRVSAGRIRAGRSG